MPEIRAERVASETDWLEQFEHDSARLNVTAHIPDDEHLQKVKKGDRKHKINQRVVESHSVHAVRACRSIN